MSKIGKKRSKPILIDVDGVVADWHKKVIDFCNEKFGTNHQRNDFENDIRKHIGKEHWEECENQINKPGFAQDLECLPGAIESINKIREKNEIVFVTSPYKSSQTWAYDRYEWLKKHFSIDRDDVIFAHDKRFINGRTLIDDRWENVIDWSQYNSQEMFPILFQQPWNRPYFQHLRNEGEEEYQYLTYNNSTESLRGSFWVGKNWEEILGILMINGCL